jgi:hypothetical protein
MKNLFIILMLFTNSILNASGIASKYDLWRNKIINFNYETNPEYGFNNFGIDIGFRYYEEKEIHKFILRNTDNFYICKDGTINNDLMDFFHFGLSIKTNDFQKYEPTLNFIFLNSTEYSFSTCAKYKDYETIKILNINSDLLNNRAINWVQYGLGYGYDFINKLGKQIIPVFFVKLGFSTYNLDKNIFNELSKYSSLQFTNFELNAGAKLYILFNPVGFDINADYSKITDGPNLDIFSVNSKFYYIDQTKGKGKFGYLDEYFIKNISVYLSCLYRNYYLSSHSQNVFNMSLGIDFYFQDENY